MELREILHLYAELPDGDGAVSCRGVTTEGQRGR